MPSISSRGNSTPQSTHDDLAAILDRGHVLADLAEAPEGDDPYGVFSHVKPLVRAGGWPAQTPVRPSRLSSAATTASLRVSAGTSGRRRPPTSCPSRLSAALTGMGFAVTNSAL